MHEVVMRSDMVPVEVVPEVVTEQVLATNATQFTDYLELDIVLFDHTAVMTKIREHLAECREYRATVREGRQIVHGKHGWIKGIFYSRTNLDSRYLPEYRDIPPHEYEPMSREEYKELGLWIRSTAVNGLKYVTKAFRKNKAKE